MRNNNPSRPGLLGRALNRRVEIRLLVNKGIAGTAQANP